MKGHDLFLFFVFFVFFVVKGFFFGLDRVEMSPPISCYTRGSEDGRRSAEKTRTRGSPYCHRHWIAVIMFRHGTGCGAAWFSAPALGAGGRRFESAHPDQPSPRLWLASQPCRKCFHGGQTSLRRIFAPWRRLSAIALAKVDFPSRLISHSSDKNIGATIDILLTTDGSIWFNKLDVTGARFCPSGRALVRTRGNDRSAPMR